MSVEIAALFSALDEVTHFERAAEVVLDRLAAEVRRATSEAGLEDVTTLLRGAVHLRPDLGYRGLISRELDSDAQVAPPLTSSTAWQAVRERGVGFCVDVHTRTFWAPDGRSWDATRATGSAAAFAETRKKLTARDTTHLLALPLKVMGEVRGMVTFELRCADAVGEPRFAPWELRGEHLQRLARVAALYLDRLPFAQEAPSSTPGPFPVTSPASRAAVDTLACFAPLDAPLLLLGESGTGKSRAAQWVHEVSGRGGPFVTADIAALSSEQASIRLFGSTRGAFTGAENRQGAVAQARGGTLFIDEIARLSMEVQVQLFRLLDEGRFRPLGPAGDEIADVRVIAATNADLPRAVRSGTFQSDLLFRLENFAVELPPLRRRAEEIEGWALLFLREFHKRRAHNHHVTISAAAALLLRQQPLPGNLRELKGLAERAWLRACLRVSPELTRWPTEVRVEEIDVAQALESPFGRREEGSLIHALDDCARLYVQEADRLRREGQRPLSLEETRAFQGAVVCAASRQLGDPGAVARLLGVEALIPGGNHLKRFREDYAALASLGGRVGAVAPPLPEALVQRREGREAATGPDQARSRRNRRSS